MKVGQTYYFITHAYYHYLGEVAEILGVRRVACRRVVQIHSDSRTWTEFFRVGCRDGKTKLDVIGEAADMSYIAAFVWHHDIPEERL